MLLSEHTINASKMKLSHACIFFVGLSLGLILAILGSRILPRFVSLRASVIPVLSKEEIESRGLLAFKRDNPIANRRDFGAIIEICQTDFSRMNQGDARLSSVYEMGDKRFIILLLDCYRDKWGKRQTDNTLVYVFDVEHGAIIGKFRISMA